MLGPVGGEKTHRCKRKFGKDIKQNPMHISIYIYIYTPSLKLTYHLNMDGWKMSFLYGAWFILRFVCSKIQARQTGGFGVPAAEEDLKCSAPRKRGETTGGQTLESNSSGRSGKMRMCLVKL